MMLNDALVELRGGRDRRKPMRGVEDMRRLSRVEVVQRKGRRRRLTGKTNQRTWIRGGAVDSIRAIDPVEAVDFYFRTVGVCMRWEGNPSSPVYARVVDCSAWLANVVCGIFSSQMRSSWPNPRKVSMA